MEYSLSNHDRGYRLSVCEALYFPFYSPYVNRHLELAKCRPQLSVGHKIVAFIESIPLLGALASLIERIIIAIYNRWFALAPPVPRHSHCLSFHARKLDLATAERKMQKNALKALREHRVKDNAVTVTDAEAATADPADTELSIKCQKSKGKGPPPHYEDACFEATLPNGVKLLGVFDGHGGSEVAKYAASQFQVKFVEAMRVTKQNVFRAFELTMHALHEYAVNKWKEAGTTACVCYIDPKAHKIYTATLGDTEAKIYRKVNYSFKSMPISCVRDWTSKKDMARVMPAIEHYAREHHKSARAVVDIWKEQTAKVRRFPPMPPSEWGLNVSRSLGDSACQGFKRKPAVIHKPKITENSINPGDIVVIASDGVWDFVPEQEMVKFMNKHSQERGIDIAYKIKCLALANHKGQDNVTVLSAIVS